MAEITLKVKVEGDKVVSASLDGLDKKAKKVADSTKKTTTQLSRLSKVGKSINNGFTSLRDTFFSLQAAAVAFAGAFAVREVVNAANEQENAVNRLNVALKTSGDFSEEASRGFQDLASSIQETTKFGDEAILNQIALAKSFGATNEQAAQIVQAATDLSASFGIDLESATRNVSKTIGGFAGELGEVIPELKELTKEQLQAGKGIELLAAQFAGAAQGQVQTFAGATAQLTNSFGDLLEQIGFIITKNPQIIALFSQTSRVLNSLTKQVEANRQTFIGLTEILTKGVGLGAQFATRFVLGLGKVVIGLGFAFEQVRTGLSGFVSLLLRGLSLGARALDNFFRFIRGDVFNPIIRGFTSFIDTVLSGFEAVERGGKRFFDLIGSDRLKKFSDDSEQSFSKLRSSIKETSEEIQKNNENSESFFAGAADGAQSLSDIFLDNAKQFQENANNIADSGSQIFEQFDQITNVIDEGVNNSLKQTTKISQDTSRSIASTAKTATRGMKNVQTQTKKVNVELVKFRTEIREGLENLGAAAAANPFDGAVRGLEQLEKRFNDIAPSLTEEQRFQLRAEIETATNVVLVGVGTGFGKEILNGAEGASKVLTGGLTLGINSFVPGLGSALGPIIGALQGTPEEVRKSVREFAQALPELLKALIQNIPIFIEELILAIPDLINALVEATPLLIQSLVAALPRLVAAFAESMPEVALQLALAMPRVAFELLRNLIPGFKGFSNIVSGAGRGFGSAVTSAGSFLFNAIRRAGSFLIDAASRVFDVFKSIGRFIFDAVKNAFRLIVQAGDAILTAGNSFFNAILDGGKRFGEALLDVVKDIVGLLGGGLSGIGGFLGDTLGGIPIVGDIIGGVGSVVGGVGDFIGGLFARGGLVPQGFPNDTFPARLTSGEFVINNALTPRLERFLDGQESGFGSGGSDIDREILLDIRDSVNRPMEVDTTVQVNEAAFANIILNLNRGNRRLA